MIFHEEVVNLACLQQFQFGSHKSDHMTVTWFEDSGKCRPNDHFGMKPSDSWLMVILQHSTTAPRTRCDFWWIRQKIDYRSLCGHFKQPIWQNYDCGIHRPLHKTSDRLVNTLHFREFPSSPRMLSWSNPARKFQFQGLLNKTPHL